MTQEAEPNATQMRSIGPPQVSTAASRGSGSHEVKSVGATSDPLHGVTLETIVTALSTHYGWDELGQRIPIRCFQSEPSVASSLKFLRKTPWARAKVVGLYLFMLREIKRSGTTVHNFPPPRNPATSA